MSEKVVLPKFDLPGKQMHPAVKLLWMVGGLMALAVLALGGALWRHHSMELAEETRKQAEIAAKTAQANAEVEQAKARSGRSQDEGRGRRGRRRRRSSPPRRRPRRRAMRRPRRLRQAQRPPQLEERFEDHRRHQGRR